MAESGTGAADWRSESEKRKSMLRKACISLFKTWIPDHPEASVARGEVHGNVRGAMSDFADSVSFVSLLSFGAEDMFAHDYLATPLSMQELLVQREGTDAFLDPKNALRVVRRKFGMMTLISRMASTFEQRNVVAIRMHAGADQAEILEFSKMLSVRVEGTATEEEADLRRRLRQTKCEHFEVLFHSELVGRRVPVPWPVKEVYSMLGRQYRAKRQISPEALADFAHRHTRKLNSKALRQLSLHCAEMKAELDAGGLDPYAEFVKAADERLMLTATRSIFDEFQSIRGERRRQRALEMSGEHFLEEEEPEDEIDAEEEFVAEAEEEGESDDEYLRLARALELIRSTLGKSFFHRISMVSGDVNFVDAALASGDETLVGEVGGLDPTEALAQARDITEPFYRARSLSSVVPQLISVGRVDDAVKAAEESLAAARSCQSEDLITAYSVTVPALLSAECFTLAASAVEEVLGRTHLIASEDEKAAAMMRVTSSLMEAGALPPVVKRSLSRAILGEDIFFWGKGSVKSPLVEVILSLLSDVDDDTLIFLQKVVVHPNTDIRRSVLRTMPLGDNDHMRNMLVSHLKDADARVRIEVLERIGWSGDAKLASYLINHLRQGEAETGLEKRALALNIARLGLSRHVPFINAMLGGCASQDSRLIRVMNPIKDDADYQRAALEVMYHLGNREARRLVYNAAHKGRGTGRKLSRRLWHVIKSRPYQEPNLPRSPHDPEYSEDETFDFMGMIARFEAEHGEPPAEDDSFFGRIKSAIFGQADAEAPTPPRQKPTGPANDIEPLVETGIPHQVESVYDADETAQSAPDNAEQEPAAEAPLGPVRAGLKIEAVVSQLGQRTSGSLPMQFHLYTSKTDTKAIWSEYRDQVTVTAGRFEVLLGLNRERIPGLPEKVWLAVEIDGDELEPRTELSRYRSVIQG